MRFRFEQQHFAAGQRQRARHREADDTGANDHAFDPIRHILNLSCWYEISVAHCQGCCWLLAGTACGTADNPYVKFKDPPLVRAKLHTVTLASDTGAIAEQVRQGGFTAVTLPPNYPQADSVEAQIWGVPEPVATKAYISPPRRRTGPISASWCCRWRPQGRTAANEINEAFFRNVLGTDVPQWPLASAQTEDVRIQAWTYLVPDILAASKRLRSNGIPVIYDPVGITTAYLGDHKTLAIRSPDGTVVQLVETAAQ